MMTHPNLSEHFVNGNNKRYLQNKGIPTLPHKPFKITPYYKKLLLDEFNCLKHTGGPLFKAVYPSTAKFRKKPFIANELSNIEKNLSVAMLGGLVIKKYESKILLFLTDKCLANCQYCFRVNPSKKKNFTSLQNLNNFRKYLSDNPAINEVIFSGGDPLSLNLVLLEKIFAASSNSSHVKSLRLHTRAPVYKPEIINKKLIDLLHKYKVKVVFHIVHPYEITKEFLEKSTLLSKKRILLFNQFPILRGINDNVEVIRQLARSCTENHIHMLSMHAPDKISWDFHYRVSLKRIFEIEDELFFTSESWLSNFRVLIDTPFGKVRRVDMTAHDSQKNIYTFRRNDHQFIFHDIPEVLDRPTPLKILLYKDSFEEPTSP